MVFERSVFNRSKACILVDNNTSPSLYNPGQPLQYKQCFEMFNKMLNEYTYGMCKPKLIKMLDSVVGPLGLSAEVLIGMMSTMSAGSGQS